jgi:uroporphyrinogen-III synthase
VPIEVPVIEIADPGDGGAALREALGRVGSFDWIVFSSANAVERVFAALPGTAGALRAHGVVADALPEVAEGGSVAPALGAPPDGGASVLVPQAAGARPALVAGLASAGYRVEAVEAYRTSHPPLDQEVAAVVASADAVTFASGSSVDGLVAAVGLAGLPPVVASIGPVTSAAVAAHGGHVDVEAPAASVAALVEALSAFAESHPRDH